MDHPARGDIDDPVAGAHALYLDYAEAVDEYRPDDFADLWTTAGRLYLDPRAPDGLAREDIAGWLIRGLRRGSFVGTLHHISGIRVRGRVGDAFDATAYVIALHRRDDGEVVTVFGRYRSRVEFENGRWRFGEHRFELVGDSPHASGAVALDWPTMRDSACRGIYRDDRP